MKWLGSMYFKSNQRAELRFGESVVDTRCWVEVYVTWIEVEDGGTMQGMGLLPSETVFTGRKTRTRVNGTFAHVEGIFSELSNVAFEGYEIHMGETTYVEEVISKEHMSRIQDTVSGKISEDGISDGNVYGTYIHGIFDMEVLPM